MNASLARPDAQAHQRAQALLPWFVAGQLTAEQAALVDQHLRGCEECRRDVELERQLRAATSVAVPATPAPAGAGRLATALGHGHRGTLQSDDASAPPDGDNTGGANTDGADSPERATAGLDESRQPDMAAALARLLPQLDFRAPAAPAAPATAPKEATAATMAPARWRTAAWWRVLFTRQAPWASWALAAQFAMIAGLVVLLAERPAAPPAYRLLGNTDGGAANLVVVFKPDTAEKELRRLLRVNQARVVDGPTVTDAYLLAVPDPQRARARLRAEAAVVLAEPLAVGELP
ncbi:zf-HC2 domain-containing protein [Rugamonas sp. CCM 8940]|uniref:zf-HC2 domain-containing protein n=1 Tax=Rugamonas sp. CCM 8940 TaxID=2765359 RepID=UPI0018F438BB|nr:zf-HC2 domain-containing protein [Rugamonas sp. CCM 8940]MBJ7311462.1 zf-HC2 domain-containing protein [Rugamonas sp. CCM 8940]